jgi:hypothetical protein
VFAEGRLTAVGFEPVWIIGREPHEVLSLAPGESIG